MKRKLFQHLVRLSLGLAILLSAAGSSRAAFRFVAWGDVTDLLPYMETNSAQVRALPVQPDFHLMLGDLYDTGFTLSAVAALNSAMDGEVSNSLSGIMIPVRGNHDTQGTGATAGWQSYFDIGKRVSGGDEAKGVPGIGGSNYTYMAGADSLTYSFDYQNCHFAGMDVPGDVTGVKSSQLSWLDSDLAAAEERGLEHAFLYWHGPVYAAGDRHGGIDAPASMIAVLNKHPIVSAVFGGHAHAFAWAHMYTNRIATVTHPFEAFIVPPVAESLAGLPDMSRCDYGVGNIRGFLTVDVDGPSFTVSLYVLDEPGPQFTKTFPVPPRLSPPDLQADGQHQFFLQGEWGRSYVLQSSSDLTQWQNLSTNTILTPEGVLIKDGITSNGRQRFYRCTPVK